MPFIDPSLAADRAAILTANWALPGRRVGRRLERLTESYWELKYDHGQLRARVARLEPDAPVKPADPAPQPGATNFVPLSSLKAIK
jgi:hypothetical protein